MPGKIIIFFSGICIGLIAYHVFRDEPKTKIVEVPGTDKRDTLYMPGKIVYVPKQVLTYKRDTVFSIKTIAPEIEKEPDDIPVAVAETKIFRGLDTANLKIAYSFPPVNEFTIIDHWNNDHIYKETVVKQKRFGLSIGATLNLGINGRPSFGVGATFGWRL